MNVESVKEFAQRLADEHFPTCQHFAVSLAKNLIVKVDVVPETEFERFLYTSLIVVMGSMSNDSILSFLYVCEQGLQSS